MPRKPRIQATDTPYHITPRGVDKQAIVVDDDDRRTLVRIFGQTVIEYRWSLRAFCLLDNHLHALVVTRDANVSVGMKLFQQTYVRHFNDRHGRVGPLFQGRFGAQVLERDETSLEQRADPAMTVVEVAHVRLRPAGGLALVELPSNNRMRTTSPLRRCRRRRRDLR